MCMWRAYGSGPGGPSTIAPGEGSWGPRAKHRTTLPGSPLSSLRVDQRPTRILAETERYRITGVVFLPPDGYRSRLSDYLNTPEHTFLALTDVELTPLNGGGPAESHGFLALSLQHIVFAVPLDQHAG